MRGKNILFLSLVAVVCLSLIANIGVSQTNTKIYIDPDRIPASPPALGHPGDEYTISVNVDNVEDLWSVYVEIYFAPYVSVMVVSEFFEATFMSENGLWQTFGPPASLRVNSLLGIAYVSITRLTDPSNPDQRYPIGVDGSGTLFTFKMSILEAGDYPIEIKNEVLLDSYGMPITHNTFQSHYYGATVNLVQTEMGARSVTPKEVWNEQVGNEEWIPVTGEEVGVEHWLEGADEFVEEWSFVENETLESADHKIFQMANYPVIPDTETIYVDGVPQATDDYTIDYETGTVTFKTGSYKDKVITADYAYGAQYEFDLTGIPVHEGTETISVNGELQTKPDDYTIDYPDGVVTFTYLLSNGSIVTADYLYNGQLVWFLAAPVVPDTETIYVDGMPQDAYAIDNFAGKITLADYPENGAVITADYTAGQWEFDLTHAPVWEGEVTVYVDGVVQSIPADCKVIESIGRIQFKYFPEDGALIEADYTYAPTKDFVGKVKNTGDVPLYVRVRFDITRLDDGRKIVFRSGQTYFGGGLGEPLPFEYLYLDEFTEWYYEWNNPPENALGENDTLYIEGDANAQWASLYSFEDIDLAGRSIADINVEGYTQYPNGYYEGADIDVYDVTGGFAWWGSLWGTSKWDWHGVRWTSDSVLATCPRLADETELNNVQILFYNYYGDAPDVIRVDSVRLKVEFATIVPVIAPVYVVQPGEETKLPGVTWTITSEHLGTYECTATVEYTSDFIKWNSWATKQSTFSFSISD